MSASLVGSEMCIRDRPPAQPAAPARTRPCGRLGNATPRARQPGGRPTRACLLYTSDAADDM
eukprot:2323827-Alexandrium_andersonii.AAC.1